MCYGAGGVDGIGREEFRRLRRHSAAAERRRMQCEVANEVRCTPQCLPVCCSLYVIQASAGMSKWSPDRL